MKLFLIFLFLLISKLSFSMEFSKVEHAEKFFLKKNCNLIKSLLISAGGFAFLILPESKTVKNVINFSVFQSKSVNIFGVSLMSYGFNAIILQALIIPLESKYSIGSGVACSLAATHNKINPFNFNTGSLGNTISILSTVIITGASIAGDLIVSFKENLEGDLELREEEKNRLDQEINDLRKLVEEKDLKIESLLKELTIMFIKLDKEKY